MNDRLDNGNPLDEEALNGGSSVTNSAANQINGVTGNNGSSNSRSASNATNRTTNRTTADTTNGTTTTRRNSLDTSRATRVNTNSNLGTNSIIDGGLTTANGTGVSDQNFQSQNSTQNTTSSNIRRSAQNLNGSLSNDNLMTNTSDSINSTGSASNNRLGSNNALLNNQSTFQDRLGFDFSNSSRNLTLADVANNSFAANAGFESGDRILSVNGQNVRNFRDFGSQLGALQGDIDVTVLRNGERQTLSFSAGDALRQLQGGGSSGNSNSLAGAFNRSTFQDRLGFDFSNNGRSLTVSDVTSNSFAATAGFESGDRIVAIDGQRVNSFRDFGGQLRNLNGDVDVTVLRDGQRETISLNVDDALQQLQATQSGRATRSGSDSGNRVRSTRALQDVQVDGQ